MALGTHWASCAGLWLAVGSGACGSGDLRGIPTIGRGSAGAPGSDRGGSAGTVEPGDLSGGEQDGGATATGGSGSETGGTAGAAGTAGDNEGPNCSNGLKDGDETDIDCGGSVCPACVEGKACMVAADCDGGECFAGICLPGSVPSRQTVTFRVHNGADEPRAVQVEGYLCSPFAIYRVEDSEATLVHRDVQYAVDYACAPEGLAVDPLGESRLASIAPGDTHDLVWDAWEERITRQKIDCTKTYPERGSTTIATVPIGIARPAQAGEYRIDVAYLIGASTERCRSQGGTVLDGPGPHCYEWEPDTESSGEICDTDLERMSVPFTLPETGDVTVDIELG
jgi:hypothetical protein